MEMERSLLSVLLLLCRLWSSVCPEPAIKNEEVGSHVTLVPTYTGAPSEITWKLNGDKVGEMELSPLNTLYYGTFRGRAEINPSNGSLTIRNLTINDSGVYKAEVVKVDNTIQETEITLTVHESKNVSSSSPATLIETSTKGSLAFSSSMETTKSHKATSPGSQTATPPSRSTTRMIEPKKPGSTTSSQPRAVGTPSRSTTHATDHKKSGSSWSIGIAAGVFVLIGIALILAWCCYKSKKGKLTMNKAPEADTLLKKVSVETKAGKDGQPEEEKTSLDAQGTGEIKTGNNVKSEEGKAFLDGPGTEETKAGNDVQPEEEMAPLDGAVTEETKAGNDVQPEEETAPLDGAVTEEAEVGNKVQPEGELASMDAPGTEETEVKNKEKPEEESSSLEAPATEETKAENNGKPEEETTPLEAPGKGETEAENKVPPGEENALLEPQVTAL